MICPTRMPRWKMLMRSCGAVSARLLLNSSTRNAWREAPSASWPLVLVVVDECATFFDSSAFKGDREAEAQ